MAVWYSVTRFSAVYLPAILLLYFCKTGDLHGQAVEPERPRIRQSQITALYFPTFGIIDSGGLYLYDTIIASAKIENLRALGPNVHIYSGWSHRIGERPVINPVGTAVWVPRAEDTVYLETKIAITPLLSANADAWYDERAVVRMQDRIDGWDYTGISVRAGAGINSQRSFYEQWERGKKLLYPQRGVSIEASAGQTLYIPVEGRQLWIPHAIWSFQLLNAPSSKLHTFTDFSGKYVHSATSGKPFAAVSTANSALAVRGDLVLNCRTGISFLTPRGVFWESPPIWYLSGFIFKFSPGIAAAVCGALGADISGARITPQYGLLIKPFIAIRVDGVLRSIIGLEYNAALQNGRHAWAISIGTPLSAEALPVITK